MSKIDWDNYVNYWEKKTDEANKDRNAVDRAPNDVVLKKYFQTLAVEENDIFLDFGCGSCRLFPIYIYIYMDTTQTIL